MTQNIFDNDEFFSAYMDLRLHRKNYNDFMEQPKMQKLMPDSKGKAILDIGCDYGHNCLHFAENGAAHVTGIDISEKMLKEARRNYAHPVITYMRMDMAELGTLNNSYDLVYSSLAFHYAEDFPALVHDIYKLLRPGGILLFSQMHPIITATYDGKGHYNHDAHGDCISYTFSDYGREGKRSGFWYVDNVENYHRMMGTIITTLAHTGFFVEDMVETLPDEHALQECPGMIKELIKPSFLIVRARKMTREM